MLVPPRLIRALEVATIVTVLSAGPSACRHREHTRENPLLRMTDPAACPANPLAIFLLADGAYLLNSELMDTLTLANRLALALGGRPPSERIVFVNADSGRARGDVEWVQRLITNRGGQAYAADSVCRYEIP